jgi:hypothetical protein
MTDKDLSYIALSYTWGEPRDEMEISLSTKASDGESDSLMRIVIEGHEVDVQTNLRQALEQLATLGMQDHIWVDAPCIIKET